MKRQEVDGGPVVPVLVPAVDVSWLPGGARKLIFDVEHDYRRFRGVIDGDTSLPAEVLADVVDDLGDMFAQDAL